MSFLRNYIEHTGGNECPDIFHTWCGLSSLASITSRKVWLSQGIFTVYPRLYVILVGPPGIKKSTAVNFSRRLIYNIGGIGIAPASITKEAITEMMAEDGGICKKVFKHNDKAVPYSHLSIYANELTSLVNSGGNASGMIEFLTDIWDLDVMEVKTKNKGHDIIIGPNINILACMTPEIMQQFLFQRIISGGFTRRCVYVYADRNNEAVPLPELTEIQKSAWDNCIALGKQIQALSGEFVWGEGAKETYSAWYLGNHQKIQEGGGAVMQGFYQSKGEYVLKVAMLVALSETQKLQLNPVHIRVAVEFLTQTEEGLQRIFEGTGRNELSPIAGEIERFLNSCPQPIKLKALYTRFYQQAKYEEIDSILLHLENAGKISMKGLQMDKGIIKLVATIPIMNTFLEERGLDTLKSLE